VTASEGDSCRVTETGTYTYEYVYVFEDGKWIIKLVMICTGAQCNVVWRPRPEVQ